MAILPLPVVGIVRENVWNKAKKRKKSRFLDFENNVKNVFSNNGCRSSSQARGQFCRSGRGRKPQVCRRNCSDTCHTVGDISTSALVGHIAISGYPSISHLFVDTFFEFGVVDNFVYRYRITVILTSDLFGCMSLWLWLCSRWRPITTSGFVRHLENVQILLFTLLPSHLIILSL